MGGDCGDKKEGQESVRNIEAFVIGFLTNWWASGDGKDGKKGYGNKPKSDISVIEATWKGGDPEEEVQVEERMGDEVEVNDSASQTVVGV